MYKRKTELKLEIEKIFIQRSKDTYCCYAEIYETENGLGGLLNFISINVQCEKGKFLSMLVTNFLKKKLLL